jgi:YggT family protein
MAVLWWLVLIYLLLLLVRMISSWVRVPPSGPIASLVSFSFRVTEPVLRPLRNVIPPIRMGAVGLDLSATVVFIVLMILLSNLPH